MKDYDKASEIVAHLILYDLHVKVPLNHWWFLPASSMMKVGLVKLKARSGKFNHKNDDTILNYSCQKMIFNGFRKVG